MTLTKTTNCTRGTDVVLQFRFHLQSRGIWCRQFLHKDVEMYTKKMYSKTRQCTPSPSQGTSVFIDRSRMSPAQLALSDSPPMAGRAGDSSGFPVTRDCDPGNAHP